MKIHQTIKLLLITFSFQAKSLTFGPITTLLALAEAQCTLSQLMIHKVRIDSKHKDFYGHIGSIL